MHPRLIKLLCAAAAVLTRTEAAGTGARTLEDSVESIDEPPRASTDAPPAGMDAAKPGDMPAPDFEHIPDDMQPPTRADGVDDPLPPLDLTRPIPHDMMAATSLAVPDDASGDEPQQRASQPMTAPEGLMPAPDKNHIPAAMLPPWLQPPLTP